MSEERRFVTTVCGDDGDRDGSYASEVAAARPLGQTRFEQRETFFPEGHAERAERDKGVRGSLHEDPIEKFNEELNKGRLGS